MMTTKPARRSLTATNSPGLEPLARELVMTREFDAPRDLVFNAWTDPKHLARWWGPKGWTATIYRMDVSPGGVWHYCIRPDEGEGQESWGIATYLEVVKPSLLVYTDAFSNKNGSVLDGPATLTRVAFTNLPGGRTKLSLHLQFATAAALEAAKAAGITQGFAETLDRLNQYLNAGHGNP